MPQTLARSPSYLFFGSKFEPWIRLYPFHLKIPSLSRNSKCSTFLSAHVPRFILGIQLCHKIPGSREQVTGRRGGVFFSFATATIPDFRYCAKKPVSSGGIGIVLFFMINLCFALPEDRMQIMVLQANSAELDQQLHRGTYVGDVEMHQGTTHIKATKAITQGNLQNQLLKAIILGDKRDQAHYWVTPEQDKPPVHAYADTIFYYPKRHLIELIGHARVEQGNNSLSAYKIAYDIVHQHVLSNSNAHQRTTIIIHPEKHS